MDRIVNIQSLTLNVSPTIHVKDKSTKQSLHPFISSVNRAWMQQSHGLGSIPVGNVIFEATDIGACVLQSARKLDNPWRLSAFKRLKNCDKVWLNVRRAVKAGVKNPCARL